jgi:Secretion system C-terminal sorting domain
VLIINQLQKNNSSSYIVAGVIDAGINFGISTSFLLKLDSNGDSLWTRIFDSPGIAKSVVQTFDGGYIFCGQYGTPPATSVYLVKTNFFGDTIWTKKGNLGFQFGRGEDVVQTPDSNFVITGTVINGIARNIFLSKIDQFGNVIWTKYYGGNNHDNGYSVDLANNGGFIITGGTYSYSTGQFANADIWLIRTDNNGDTLWTRSHGGTENEEGFSVKSCIDGGYILTGYTGIQPDIFLLKTDSLGNAPTITSVEDSPQYKSPVVNVYPNPSKGWIAIEFEARVSSTDLRFSIYDCSGKKIRQFDEGSIKTGENHYQLNIANLAKGLYFLKIDLGGTTQLTKFLKL